MIVKNSKKNGYKMMQRKGSYSEKKKQNKEVVVNF